MQELNGQVREHLAWLSVLIIVRGQFQIEQLVQTNQRLINEQETLKKAFGRIDSVSLHYWKEDLFRLETKLIELQTDQTQEKNTITTDLQAERDGLQQENRLCQAAINEWSTRFEAVRSANERMTAYETLPLQIDIHPSTFLLDN